MAESDYTAAYITAANKSELSPNFYIEIEGFTEKFSNKTVVGLANNVPNLLLNPSLTGQKVDIDSPKTPLQSFSFRLLDQDNAVSAIFAEKDIHDKTVKFFYSPDDTLDFSEYGLKAEFRLKDLKAVDGNEFIIRCIETGELLLDRLIIGETIISNDIDETQITGIFVENSDEFSGTGTKKAYMGQEKISFSGVDSENELTGVTRGVDSTTAEAHDAGDEFEIYRIVTSVNLIDVILQLIISPTGGGAFDVLDFGMGIRQELVDIPAFEKIRDETAYITTPDFDIEFRGDEDNFLSFLEKNYLEIAGLRIWYTDAGKISLLIIAEPTPILPPVITKDDMVNGLMPQWEANSRRIVNKLVVSLNFNPTTEKFEKELVFIDQESIDTYGLKKVKKLSTRALQTANGAQVFLNSFANKYFTFYSTPAPSLRDTKLLSGNQFFDAGEIIDISHPDLPNLAAPTRGILENSVQVLGKKFNFSDSTTKYDIFYSILLNLRVGFIAPTGYVAAGVHTTGIFDLETGEGDKFRVGDVVNLWNDNYAITPIDHGQSTITDITGDQITVSPPFGTLPTEKKRLRYGDFDQVQERQKIYAFVSQSGGGDFGDGSKSYKIGT